MDVDMSFAPRHVVGSGNIATPYLRCPELCIQYLPSSCQTIRVKGAEVER